MGRRLPRRRGRDDGDASLLGVSIPLHHYSCSLHQGTCLDASGSGPSPEPLTRAATLTRAPNPAHPALTRAVRPNPGPDPNPWLTPCQCGAAWRGGVQPGLRAGRAARYNLTRALCPTLTYPDPNQPALCVSISTLMTPPLRQAALQEQVLRQLPQLHHGAHPTPTLPCILSRGQGVVIARRRRARDSAMSA